MLFRYNAEALFSQKGDEALAGATTWTNLENTAVGKPVTEGHMLDDAILGETSRIGKSIRTESRLGVW